VAVKESVFPFDRFGQTDIFLRPEMRSTGEVMGIAPKFGEAVFKAFQAAGITIPKSGTVFLSVNDNDKARALPIAEGLRKFGYHLVATQGTADYLSTRGIAVKIVLKIREGRPNVVDDIKNGQIDMIINTPLGQRSRTDEYAIGWTAIINRVPFITTLSAAEAIVRGLKAHNHQPVHYKCLQDYYRS
ncbi:MAG: carbamoyl phosphate synthase large subunit, partial [Desulfobacterales bacterium]